MNTSPKLYFKNRALDEKYRCVDNSKGNNIGGSNTNIYSKEVMVDERKGDAEGLNIKDKDKPPNICIPLQSTSELCDTGDFWRAWSCIILAYLLKNTIISLADKTMNNSSKQGDDQNIQHYRRGNLKQRGRYLTRRQGKCWQKLKNVTRAFATDD